MTSWWGSHGSFLAGKFITVAATSLHCNPLQGSTEVYREIPVRKTGSLQWEQGSLKWKHVFPCENWLTGFGFAVWSDTAEAATFYFAKSRQDSVIASLTSHISPASYIGYSQAWQLLKGFNFQSTLSYKL